MYVGYIYIFRVILTMNTDFTKLTETEKRLPSLVISR